MVGIVHLDGEPPLRTAGFGAEFERRGDGAGDIVPGDGDFARGGKSEGGECCWEEVECFACAAARTFIDNHGSNLLSTGICD